MSDTKRRMICAPWETLTAEHKKIGTKSRCCECGCPVGIAPSSKALLEEGATPICHHCVDLNEGQLQFPTRAQIVSLVEQCPEDMLQQLMYNLAHWETMGPQMLRSVKKRETFN